MKIRTYARGEEVPSDGIKIYVPEGSKLDLEKLGSSESSEKIVTIINGIAAISKDIDEIRNANKDGKYGNEILSRLTSVVEKISDSVVSQSEEITKIKENILAIDKKINELNKRENIYLDEIKSAIGSIEIEDESLAEIKKIIDNISEAVREMGAKLDYASEIRNSLDELTIAVNKINHHKGMEDISENIKEIKTRLDFNQINEAKVEKALKLNLSGFGKVSKSINELKSCLSFANELEQLTRALAGAKLAVAKSGIPASLKEQKKNALALAANAINSVIDVLVLKLLSEQKLTANQLLTIIHSNPRIVKSRIVYLEKEGKIKKIKEGKKVLYSLM